MVKLDLQLFATKKGAGSTRNVRDSHSKRLDAKRADGQFDTGGSILMRQRGTTIYEGENVELRRVDIVLAKIDAIVKSERNGRKNKKVSVYPESVEAET